MFSRHPWGIVRKVFYLMEIGWYRQGKVFIAKGLFSKVFDPEDLGGNALEGLAGLVAFARAICQAGVFGIGLLWNVRYLFAA